MLCVFFSSFVLVCHSYFYFFFAWYPVAWAPASVTAAVWTWEIAVQTSRATVEVSCRDFCSVFRLQELLRRKLGETSVQCSDFKNYCGGKLGETSVQCSDFKNYYGGE